MSPTESNESPVSYIRSRTSDLPKVGMALKNLILTDERCTGDAQRLTEYWRRKPDQAYESVSYDTSRKKFILLHKVDGEVLMEPERFYAHVAQKTKMIIQKTIQELSQGVSGKIKTIK